MNTKNNKRRQASVERIRKAFFSLLKTRELSDIRVSEICEMANINRSTFYVNFDGVYGLADVIYDELLKEVGEFFDIRQDPFHCEDDFLNLFNHIKDNQEMYRFYFKLGYEKERFSKDKFISNEDLAREKSVDYRIVFFKNGFNAIVKLWLNNGCKESPQTMCDTLLHEYRGRLG